ncbi:hypothetical protein KC345_g9506 [Hortaea werneckii]|nr:hypothetical protein KC345_g9506 [Hortaea werneckii]
MEDPQTEPANLPTMTETMTRVRRIESLQEKEQSPSDTGPLSVQGESMAMDAQQQQQQQREGSNEEYLFAEGNGKDKGILGGKRDRDAVSPSGREDWERAGVKRVRSVDSEGESEGGQDDETSNTEDVGSIELADVAQEDLAGAVNAALHKNAVLRQDTPGPQSRTMSGLPEDLDDLKEDMDEVQNDRTHWRIKATELSVKLGELRK